MKKKYITAEEFDKRFDNGEDVLEYLDMTQAHRPGLELKRINVEFPLWMIKSLDKEAKRLGVSIESIIKVWIAERLHNTSA